MLARMMVSRCCCGDLPEIVAYWFYGGITAFLNYGTGVFTPDVTPGTVVTVSHTLSRNDVTIRPYGVVYFPIAADPGDTITSAMFELTQDGGLGSPDVITGNFLARSQMSNVGDIPGVLESSWLSVTGWGTETPVPFSFGPIGFGGQQTVAFDVTALVQAFINAPNFVRGASFAAILEYDSAGALSDDYNNSGLMSGLWTDGTPQPNTGVVQCELIIT